METWMEEQMSIYDGFAWGINLTKHYIDNSVLIIEEVYEEWKKAEET
jgi:hypothetical protein